MYVRLLPSSHWRITFLNGDWDFYRCASQKIDWMSASTLIPSHFNQMTFKWTATILCRLKTKENMDRRHKKRVTKNNNNSNRQAVTFVLNVDDFNTLNGHGHSLTHHGITMTRRLFLSFSLDHSCSTEKKSTFPTRKRNRTNPNKSGNHLFVAMCVWVKETQMDSSMLDRFGDLVNRYFFLLLLLLVLSVFSCLISSSIHDTGETIQCY